MSRPATAGPKSRAPLKIDEFSATAFMRSARPTISTVNAWRAGMSNVFASPRRPASTSTCQ
jgi:hypothetical protein